MKQGIHPDYKQTTIRCACGNVIETGSTKENIVVDVCSKCHPFFTGKQKLVDTGGRVDRFKKRFNLDKNEKSHRNVFSVAFSLSVCRLRKGVCGTGGLVRLNRAGGSSCPGVRLSAPIRRGTRVALAILCPGGKFFAEPQRRVAVCGRQEIRCTHGGGQEGRHLRFLPS